MRNESAPDSPARTEPFETRPGQAVDQRFRKALFDRRNAAGVADQQRQPTPPRAGRRITLEGERLDHHLPDVVFRRGREAPHCDGRRDVLVRARVEMIGELSLHPARVPTQRRHDLGVGPLQGAHEQNIAWPLELPAELVDVFLECVSVAGANLPGGEDIGGLDELNLHALGPAMIAQGRQGAAKRRRGHDDPLRRGFFLGSDGQNKKQEKK